MGKNIDIMVMIKSIYRKQQKLSRRKISWLSQIFDKP